MLPQILFCERCNLVSFGDVLLRFCLKNDNNIYPLCKNNVHAGWVLGHANYWRMLLNDAIWSVF